MGEAFVFLARFHCQAAIGAFEAIEAHHRETPWVMGSIGRAHFEMGEYNTAKNYFQRMRDLGLFNIFERSEIIMVYDYVHNVSKYFLSKF